MTTQPLLISLRDAAAIVGIPPRRYRAWARQGKVPGPWKQTRSYVREEVLKAVTGPVPEAAGPAAGAAAPSSPLPPGSDPIMERLKRQTDASKAQRQVHRT